MNTQNIPQIDSIKEMAKFWDTHDLTDFEDQLEEVTEPVFERQTETVINLHLPFKRLFWKKMREDSLPFQKKAL